MAAESGTTERLDLKLCIVALTIFNGYMNTNITIQLVYLLCLFFI